MWKRNKMKETKQEDEGIRDEGDLKIGFLICGILGL